MHALRAFTLFAIYAAVGLISPGAAQAAESYDNCTGFITSIPATISTQGTWCLKQDLATGITSGDAITIATNNVTIDCNDFKLGGLSAGLATEANGIYANARLNATVRNCTIRGFYQGIYFIGAGGGHAIEDNRFDGNTVRGMSVDGDGSVVRRNRVFDTGGSSVNTVGIGISTLNSVDVIDNIISGVVSSSTSDMYGILTNGNIDATVSGNRIRGLSSSGTGVARGIHNLNSIRIAVTNNYIVGNSVAGGVGIRCLNATGSAKDNQISGFTTAIDTCSNDGGNTVH